MQKNYIQFNTYIYENFFVSSFYYIYKFINIIINRNFKIKVKVKIKIYYIYIYI